MLFIRTLEEGVRVEVKGMWYTVDVVLASEKGGKKVVYVTKDGSQVHTQPLSKSKYKDVE